MTREIFIDAGFWIALFYRWDQQHDRARMVWDELMTQRWPIVTSNWTLYETVTFLNGRPRRHDLAIAALDFVSQLSEIVYIEHAELETRSLEIFRAHSDEGWSVVDCASFACIESRQSEFAISYDRNFEHAQAEFGFQFKTP